MDVKTFVDTFKVPALKVELASGVPAKFILAQAALESGWGEHAPGNMFFGVKASKDTPDSEKQLLKTTEYFSDNKQGKRFPEVIEIRKVTESRYKYFVFDWFRKFKTPEESFLYQAKIFAGKRYAEAMMAKDDPYTFADEVQKAGYATAPNYAKTIKSLITKIDKYYGSSGI